MTLSSNPYPCSRPVMGVSSKLRHLRRSIPTQSNLGRVIQYILASPKMQRETYYNRTVVPSQELTVGSI